MSYSLNEHNVKMLTELTKIDKIYWSRYDYNRGCGNIVDYFKCGEIEIVGNDFYTDIEFSITSNVYRHGYSICTADEQLLSEIKKQQERNKRSIKLKHFNKLNENIKSVVDRIINL